AHLRGAHVPERDRALFTELRGSAIAFLARLAQAARAEAGVAGGHVDQGERLRARGATRDRLGLGEEALGSGSVPRAAARDVHPLDGEGVREAVRLAELQRL